VTVCKITLDRGTVYKAPRLLSRPPYATALHLKADQSTESSASKANNINKKLDFKMLAEMETCAANYPCDNKPESTLPVQC
jgi:hypothetical protein